jgi:hypothetical protein
MASGRRLAEDMQAPLSPWLRLQGQVSINFYGLELGLVWLFRFCGNYEPIKNMINLPIIFSTRDRLDCSSLKDGRRVAF